MKLIFFFNNFPQNISDLRNFEDCINIKLYGSGSLKNVFNNDFDQIEVH